MRPEVQNAAFLRDVSAESLGKYSAIYLFDVDRLDDRARENLEAYVRAGGGLAIFVGPQVNIAFYQQQLYRDGPGPVPAAARPRRHADRRRSGRRAGRGNRSDRPSGVSGTGPGPEPAWCARCTSSDSCVRSRLVARGAAGVRVLARLRNRAPLAVEKSFGQGRVIAFLTTYAPYWNDMVLGPNVIVALRLQSYLGFARRATDDRTVQRRDQGAAQRRAVSARRAGVPAHRGSGGAAGDRTAGRRSWPPTRARCVATIAPQETERAGIYEMWFHRVDGSIQADRFAVNVEPAKGTWPRHRRQDIVAQLDPVPVDMGYADQYESAAIEQAGFNQSMLLMGLLILLLLGEQVLAYFNSFHAHRGHATGPSGTPRPPGQYSAAAGQNEADDAGRQARAG